MTPTNLSRGSLSKGERLYRALLHLYPREFRAEYSAGMIEMFRARRTPTYETRSPKTHLAFWASIIGDLVITALKERGGQLFPKRAEPDGSVTASQVIYSSIGLTFLLLGLSLEFWARGIFVALTGQSLSTVDGEPIAPAVLGGVGVIRVLGGVLVLCGVVPLALATTHDRIRRRPSVAIAICIGTAFTTVIAIIQQVTVWRTGAGLGLVLGLAGASIISGIAAIQLKRRSADF